jgi:hypothetical protein
MENFLQEIADKIDLVNGLHRKWLSEKRKLEALQRKHLGAYKKEVVMLYLRRWEQNDNPILFEKDQELVDVIFYLGGDKSITPTPTININVNSLGKVVMTYHSRIQKKLVVLDSPINQE